MVADDNQNLARRNLCRWYVMSAKVQPGFSLIARYGALVTRPASRVREWRRWMVRTRHQRCRSVAIPRATVPRDSG